MIEVVETIAQLDAALATWRAAGKSVGLVPTMGFLHEGHQSLITRAVAENDAVVVSVFVNPTQFAVGEDLETYPRDLAQDKLRCEEAGASLIFAPSAAEMYPAGYNSYVTTFGVSELLEGQSRPTHFRGVTTVVTKLFNLIRPDKAYFGQKDAQQVAVLQQMVRDLNQGVDLIVCPIIREADGLAKSSRNTYLNTEERAQAVVLSQALKLAENLMSNGERQARSITTALEQLITEKPLATVDYIAIVDKATLQEVTLISQDVLILLAVYVGKTRLIDNTIIHLEEKNATGYAEV
jgi:pantoate--beta-alanine ligase